MGNFIAPSDPLVAESFEEGGVRFLRNEAWITSNSTGTSVESKIIFENYDKKELGTIFDQFRRLKIFPSVVPVALLSEEKKARTRDSWWVVAVK